VQLFRNQLDVLQRTDGLRVHRGFVLGNADALRYAHDPDLLPIPTGLHVEHDDQYVLGDADHDLRGKHESNDV
jgi:hypothetical protein